MLDSSSAFTATPNGATSVPLWQSSGWSGGLQYLATLYNENNEILTMAQCTIMSGTTGAPTYSYPGLGSSLVYTSSLLAYPSGGQIAIQPGSPQRLAIYSGVHISLPFAVSWWNSGWSDDANLPGGLRASLVG